MRTGEQAPDEEPEWPKAYPARPRVTVTWLQPGDQRPVAPPRRRRLGPVLGIAALLACLVAAGAGYRLIRPDHRPAGATPLDAPAGPAAPSATATARGELAFTRAPGGGRTLAVDTAGTVVASFTDGARTVVVVGPQRVFTDPAHTDTDITTTAWVRLAPKEWHAGAETDGWAGPWLAAELADTSPDVLAVATQYLEDAPERTDDKGVRYAGNASFGPVSDTDPDGRAENSDFYDYLGVSWTFPDAGAVAPKQSRYGDVDCSGFLRLVYGYRLGYPLRDRNTPGAGLPRRAFAISQFAGVEVIPNRGVPPTGYGPLQPGDLVFFNSDPGTSSFRTDHSGIFLGVDSDGHYRFISSRSKADGPTFGDTGGAAILDGGGYWSARIRDARRL